MRHWMRRVLVILGLAAVVVMMPLVAVVIATTVNGNHALIVAIQRERARNIEQNCRDTNARHDVTIRRLHQLVEQLPPGPRKVRAVQGMAGSVALIDALAPRRDCRALAARQVDTQQ
jgi:hypothetical protein